MSAAESELQEHFLSLPDQALLEIHRDDLTQTAKAVYDHEMLRRGLVADEADDPSEDGTAPALGGSEKLVSVVEFESAEDAAEAQAFLKKNSIPAFISVSVPAAFAQQAVHLLDPGVSDEELIRLAGETAAEE